MYFFHPIGAKAEKKIPFLSTFTELLATNKKSKKKTLQSIELQDSQVVS